MARPKAAEKRDRQINIALTAREFDLIRERADAVGLRVVEYARAAVLRRRNAVDAFTAVTPLDRMTVEGLRRIGVNLNQAARQFNTFGHTVPPELGPLLRDIRALVAKVIADGP